MKPYDVVFLLVPRFSMIALYGALEPLRVANRFAGQVFSWRFVSADGKPVAASNDIPVLVSGTLKELGRPRMAVVSASFDHETGMTRPVLAAIRRVGRSGSSIAGIDTGPFLMAEAGVLDGYRATCHWESLPGFRESYPGVEVTQALYEIDRDRLTCAGGASSIDMMLDWIGRMLGRPLAMTVADQLVHFRFADASSDDGRVPPMVRYGIKDRRLLAIIAAMEEHTEEPLRAGALARIGGLSVRQMERLFETALDARPIGFYHKLRLEKAERLLNYSHMSVRDVALACGFSSLALFSRAFKTAYGKAPSAFRRDASPKGATPREVIPR